jgi:hypothetical protein
MHMKNKILGATLAGAVALAFILPSHSSETTQYGRKWVKCYGINSCRGKSACQITTNSCKVLNRCRGQNSCKGHGFEFKSPEKCKLAGGTTPETPGALNGY